MKTEIQTASCKNCSQDIYQTEQGEWLHDDGDQSATCEIYAEPDTSRSAKPSGYALWDLRRKFTVLFCVECFNERFDASIMVELADRVDTLFQGGTVANCINCAKAVN
jgi:hypothetical protein